MPSIKENIKEELLKKINEEWMLVGGREAAIIPWSAEEQYQIDCEKRFLRKLEEFVKSI